VAQKPEPLRAFQPRSARQQDLWSSLEDADLLFVLGPAGTGKTHVTCHHGVDRLQGGTLDRYVILRPAVAVEDEDPGALPGELDDKMAPWAAPVARELTKIAGASRVANWRDKGNLEVQPIAFIRGLTFEHALIHVTEAQNLTIKQAKAIITRFGEGSQMVIEGDPDQSDIEGPNGLEFLLRIAREDNIPHTAVEFDEADVVRHPLVRMFATAFKKRAA
jgi:phosphate starvation-inducible protein PhoH and related proteins